MILRESEAHRTGRRILVWTAFWMDFTGCWNESQMFSSRNYKPEKSDNSFFVFIESRWNNMQNSLLQRLHRRRQDVESSFVSSLSSRLFVAWGWTTFGTLCGFQVSSQKKSTRHVDTGWAEVKIDDSLSACSDKAYWSVWAGRVQLRFVDSEQSRNTFHQVLPTRD